MGKNSKRRNYTRYKYAVDDLYAGLRLGDPGLSSLDNAPNTLRRKQALDWVERQRDLSDETIKEAYRSIGKKETPDEVTEHRITTMRVWLTVAQEILFDLSPDSIHLFLTDPDLVALLESSEYEDLRASDLRFPSDRIMVHFKRGTRFADREVSSLLLTKFHDSDEVVSKLNGMFPETRPARPFGLPLDDYWSLSVVDLNWTPQNADDDSNGFYYATVVESGFVEALNKKAPWQHDGGAALGGGVTALMRFIGGLGVYLKSYPEALREGPPLDAVDHDGRAEPSKARSLNPMPDGLAQAVRACQAGKGVAITPHLRRMHWRRLPDDVERYPNKHGLLIPVKSCFVGKAKTVLDVTEPAP